MIHLSRFLTLTLALVPLNLHALGFSKAQLDETIALLDKPALITVSGSRNLLGSCTGLSSFEKLCNLQDTVIDSDPLHPLFWGASGTTVEIRASMKDMAYDFTARVGGGIQGALPQLDSAPLPLTLPDYSHAASGGRLRVNIHPSALGESLLDSTSTAELKSIVIQLGKQKVLSDLNKKGDEIVAELESTQRLYVKGKAFLENANKTLGELTALYASLSDKDGPEGSLPAINFFQRFDTLPPASACPVTVSPWSEYDPSHTQYECAQVQSIIMLTRGFPSPFSASEVQGYRDVLVYDAELLENIIRGLTRFSQGYTNRFACILDDLVKNHVISQMPQGMRCER